VAALDDGRLTIDLVPIVEAVRDELIDRGLTVLDRIDLTRRSWRVTVTDGAAVDGALRALRNVELVSWVAPVAAVVALAVGALAAPRRRGTVVLVGLAAAAVVALAVTALLRRTAASLLSALGAADLDAAAAVVTDLAGTLVIVTAVSVVIVGAALVLTLWDRRGGRRPLVDRGL
jgi:hypothetical protein